MRAESEERESKAVGEMLINEVTLSVGRGSLKMTELEVSETMRQD